MGKQKRKEGTSVRTEATGDDKKVAVSLAWSNLVFK